MPSTVTARRPSATSAWCRPRRCSPARRLPRWFWVPLTILIIGLSSIPHCHRLRVGRRGVRLSDAGRRTRRTPAQRGGFGLGIGVPPATIAIHRVPELAESALAGHQRRPVLEGHRAPLSADGVRHVDRGYGARAAGRRSWARRRRSRSGRATTTPGWRSSPALAFLTAVIAVAGAVAILVFARLPSTPSSTAGCCRRRRRPRCSTRSARSPMPARGRVVGADRASPHRARLHDSVQPRLVSLAMTIGLARTARHGPARGQAVDRRGARRRQGRSSSCATWCAASRPPSCPIVDWMRRCRQWCSGRPFRPR